MRDNIYVGIMAGGAGTRFWPASRESKPKQFLDILGTGKSLLQSTYERFLKVCPPENIYVITSEKYVGLVEEQIPEISEEQIVKEPLRRNTAPCIAYATYKIFKKNENADIIISPADHYIENDQKFIETIQHAVAKASGHDKLITIGIEPTRPDTGYGYIQFMKTEDSNGIYKVKTFTEKPSPEIAMSFIESGEFLWNAGIFVWNAKAVLKGFKMYLPEIYEVFEAGMPLYNTNDEVAFVQDAYALCTNISIDYGLMEKASNVYVIPGDFGWSDLGTWDSVYNKLEKDKTNSVILGSNVMNYGSKNCIVKVPDEKLVIIKGLDNLIIVESDDTLMILPKEEEQSVKNILKDVREKKGEWFL